MPRDYVERILKARVYDVAVESSLDPAPRLSRRLDNNVLLKREDLQPVFSLRCGVRTTKSITSAPRSGHAA